MALRVSEADSVWEFTHNNARSIMHVNHFTFHPLTAVLLYGVIVDQSDWSLLKIHAKPENGTHFGQSKL